MRFLVDAQLPPALGSTSRVADKKAVPRGRFRCVPGMFSSLEVQVLYPT